MAGTEDVRRGIKITFCVTVMLVIPVFGIGIVRFENGVCNSSSNLEGTCYTRNQCRSVSGYGSGRCANNIGVCCVSKL